MGLKAQRYVGCDSDKCYDCERYADYCDGCGRRLCVLSAVSTDDEIYCRDCAEETVCFGIANDIDVSRYEKQLKELDEKQIVRVGPLRPIA